jgi:hypothetical protein
MVKIKNTICDVPYVTELEGLVYFKALKHSIVTQMEGARVSSW